MLARVLGGVGLLAVSIALQAPVAETAPVVDPAKTVAESPAADHSREVFSDMVEIPAGRFRMGLTFNEINKLMKWCEQVDKSCTRSMISV